jgi:hypothetical protein
MPEERRQLRAQYLPGVYLQQFQSPGLFVDMDLEAELFLFNSD